jgi:hypothetical protein
MARRSGDGVRSYPPREGHNQMTGVLETLILCGTVIGFAFLLAEWIK